MIENIKQMYNQMLDDYKKEGIDALVSEFKYSKVAIKQNWIYGEMIPEKHQPKVIGIFQQILKKQYQKTGQLIKY